MRLIQKWLLLLSMLVCTGLAAEQLEGFVFDQSSEKPLAMVNIVIRSGETGTVTDANGHFVITGTLNDSDSLLVSHIGYRELTVSIEEVKDNPNLYLQPLSIMMDGVQVEGIYQKYQMDTPVDIQIIDRELIIERAPSNLGELLRMEPAIQVQSSSPGYQTVSIRGSNPEQVLVLYDGIPIRSAADDIADISWIDVNDIGEVQVLKSGQSVMFGEGAIGGVLNLRSSFDSKYWLRTTGRYGNFDTRDGYISLRKAWGNWESQYSMSIKTANYMDDQMADIATASAFHNLRSSLTFGNSGKLTLRGMVMDRFLSEIYNLNETDDERYISSLQYEGPLLGADHLLIQGLWREYKTSYLNFVPWMPTRPQDRFEKTIITDEVTGAKVEQSIKRNNLNVSYGVQYFLADFESDLSLDFIKPTSFEMIHDIRHLQRESVGVYNVMKYLTETGSEIFPVLDWNWSLRYDYAYTERFFENPLLWFVDEKYDTDLYRALNYKIGLETRGGKNNNSQYRIFLTNGANVRFPSLYDVYLNDISKLVAYQDSSLNSERLISSEVGAAWTHDINKYGVFFNTVEWRLSVFQNSYISKIYYMAVIGALPVAINWNKESSINGVDMNLRVNIFADRLILDLGGLWLNIKDPWLFPNKPTMKYQADLSYSYKRLSCRLRGFFEGEQTGLARLPGGQTFFEDLNERADMDVYLNYKFLMDRFDILCGLSATNIFSNENSGIIYSYLNRIRMIQFTLTVGIK